MIPRRVRRPADLLRLAIALLSFLVIIVVTYFLTKTTAGIEQDIVEASSSLPGFLVLVLNLASLLHTQAVSNFPWDPQRAPDYGVKVNLLQLEANEQQAMLTAEWLVYRPSNGAAVVRRISRLQAPLTPGAAAPEQVAAAYSAMIFQLSELIAAGITSAGETRSE